jgi:L-lysine 2,3-aminomutase
LDTVIDFTPTTALAPIDVHTGPTPLKYRPYTQRHLDEIPQIRQLQDEDRLAMKAVAAVLPFRANAYVVEELIDWTAVPDDPIFRLVFPQPGMLAPSDLKRMTDLLRRNAPAAEIEQAAHAIRMRLNPHPAGQMDRNVPWFRGRPLHGLQHKYAETVLFFPSHGQTCHAYCTYCFRWAQFIGDPDLKMVSQESEALQSYLLEHPEVTDVLITGGDPMIMKAEHLVHYIEPLLNPRLSSLRTIRIGTKSIAYWPHRYCSDDDSIEILRLFERIGKAGKQLAIMAHYSHPRDLETPIAAEAVRCIRETGAIIRAQAPLIRGINDTAQIWADLWRSEVNKGIIPYYMFVERNTGPKNYFEAPLARLRDLPRCL